jgi:DNA-directed RNA polymerase specialized sigma24 family protein
MTPEQFNQALTPQAVSSAHNYAANLSPVHGEDIAQDALLAALRGCDGFDGRCDFVGWLIRITKNTAFNHSKMRGRYRARVQPCNDADRSHGSETPHGCLVAQRTLSLISDTVASIKPVTRDAWLAYHTTPVGFRDLPGSYETNKSRIKRVQDQIQGVLES